MLPSPSTLFGPAELLSHLESDQWRLAGKWEHLAPLLETGGVNTFPPEGIPLLVPSSSSSFSADGKNNTTFDYSCFSKKNDNGSSSPQQQSLLDVVQAMCSDARFVKGILQPNVHARTNSGSPLYANAWRFLRAIVKNNCTVGGGGAADTEVCNLIRDAAVKELASDINRFVQYFENSIPAIGGAGGSCYGGAGEEAGSMLLELSEDGSASPSLPSFRDKKQQLENYLKKTKSSAAAIFELTEVSTRAVASPTPSNQQQQQQQQKNRSDCLPSSSNSPLGLPTYTTYAKQLLQLCARVFSVFDTMILNVNVVDAKINDVETRLEELEQAEEVLLKESHKTAATTPSSTSSEKQGGSGAAAAAVDAARSSSSSSSHSSPTVSSPSSSSPSQMKIKRIQMLLEGQRALKSYLDNLSLLQKELIEDFSKNIVGRVEASVIFLGGMISSSSSHHQNQTLASNTGNDVNNKMSSSANPSHQKSGLSADAAPGSSSCLQNQNRDIGGGVAAADGPSLDDKLSIVNEFLQSLGVGSLEPSSSSCPVERDNGHAHHQNQTTKKASVLKVSAHLRSALAFYRDCAASVKLPLLQSSSCTSATLSLVELLRSVLSLLPHNKDLQRELGDSQGEGEQQRKQNAFIDDAILVDCFAHQACLIVSPPAIDAEGDDSGNAAAMKEDAAAAAVTGGGQQQQQQAASSPSSALKAQLEANFKAAQKLQNRVHQVSVANNWVMTCTKMFATVLKTVSASATTSFSSPPPEDLANTVLESVGSMLISSVVNSDEASCFVATDCVVSLWAVASKLLFSANNKKSSSLQQASCVSWLYGLALHAVSCVSNKSGVVRSNSNINSSSSSSSSFISTIAVFSALGQLHPIPVGHVVSSLWKQFVFDGSSSSSSSRGAFNNNDNSAQEEENQQQQLIIRFLADVTPECCFPPHNKSYCCVESFQSDFENYFSNRHARHQQQQQQQPNMATTTMEERLFLISLAASPATCPWLSSTVFRAGAVHLALDVGGTNIQSSTCWQTIFDKLIHPLPQQSEQLEALSVILRSAVAVFNKTQKQHQQQSSPGSVVFSADLANLLTSCISRCVERLAKIIDDANVESLRQQLLLDDRVGALDEGDVSDSSSFSTETSSSSSSLRCFTLIEAICELLRTLPRHDIFTSAITPANLKLHKHALKMAFTLCYTFQNAALQQWAVTMLATACTEWIETMETTELGSQVLSASDTMSGRGAVVLEDAASNAAFVESCRKLGLFSFVDEGVVLHKERLINKNRVKNTGISPSSGGEDDDDADQLPAILTATLASSRRLVDALAKRRKAATLSNAGGMQHQQQQQLSAQDQSRVRILMNDLEKVLRS